MSQSVALLPSPTPIILQLLYSTSEFAYLFVSQLVVTSKVYCLHSWWLANRTSRRFTPHRDTVFVWSLCRRCLLFFRPSFERGWFYSSLLPSNFPSSAHTHSLFLSHPSHITFFLFALLHSTHFVLSHRLLLHYSYRETSELFIIIFHLLLSYFNHHCEKSLDLPSSWSVFWHLPVPIFVSLQLLSNYHYHVWLYIWQDKCLDWGG
jgi:hypothetical protein